MFDKQTTTRGLSSNETGRRSRFTKIRVPVLIALTLLATVWLAQILWAGGMKDRYIPKGFEEVVPGRLYRSGQISRWLIDDVLKENKIGIIIYFNHNEEKKNRHREKELDVAWNYRIAYTDLPMPDHGMGDIHRYAEAMAVINHYDGLNQPVLMHDESGTRAVSIAVAFYRMFMQRWKTEDVVRELLAEGWPVEDRPMLKNYLNDHLPVLAEKLVEMKVIQKVPENLPLFRF